MNLDELFAALIVMLHRGVDPDRLREELELAIKLSGKEQKPK